MKLALALSGARTVLLSFCRSRLGSFLQFGS
jgi:hypothetical protein